MNKELTITHETLDSLIPHPENNKYFTDMSGEAWEAFLEDVKEYGITEPLTIDEATRHIIKGNQRYRAARILQMETVPCIVRPYEDANEALDDLIRDNAMRRDMGLLDKYKLVGHLKTRLEDRRKKNGDGGGENKGGADSIPPRDQICQILGLHQKDISAALALETLSPSEKEEFFEWVNKANPSKKNMYQQIKKLKGKIKEQDIQARNMKGEMKKQKERIKDLEYLEEIRLDVMRRNELMEHWKETDPDSFAMVFSFEDITKDLKTTTEFMAECLAPIKDRPVHAEVIEIVRPLVKEIIFSLDEYRNALWDKFIAEESSNEDDPNNEVA